MHDRGQRLFESRKTANRVDGCCERDGVMNLAECDETALELSNSSQV